MVMRGWVKNEIKVIKVLCEQNQARNVYSITAAEQVATNARGIASNALSSAQRADSKVEKYLNSNKTIEVSNNG